MSQLLADLEGDTYNKITTVPIYDDNAKCGYCGVTGGTLDVVFDDDDPDSATLSVDLTGTCGDEVSDDYGMDDDYDFAIAGTFLDS